MVNAKYVLYKQLLNPGLFVVLSSGEKLVCLFLLLLILFSFFFFLRLIPYNVKFCPISALNIACTQNLLLGNSIQRCFAQSAWGRGERAKGRACNLRSAPCSAWLICQIIKVEWTKQKKAGNDPLGPCSFNREAVKTQFSCPLRKLNYGAHFISNNKAAKKCF